MFKTSQASDVGSIPIARSINPVDAVGFTGFHPQNRPIKSAILDAVGRGFSGLRIQLDATLVIQIAIAQRIAAPFEKQSKKSNCLHEAIAAG